MLERGIRSVDIPILAAGVAHDPSACTPSRDYSRVIDEGAERLAVQSTSEGAGAQRSEALHGQPAGNSTSTNTSNNKAKFPFHSENWVLDDSKGLSNKATSELQYITKMTSIWTSRNAKIQK